MCVCARQACVRCSFHQIFGFFAKGQWVSSCFFGLAVVFVCSSLRMRAANGRFPGPVSPSSLDSLGNETEPVKPNTAHCILSCSFLKTTRRSTVCCSSTVSAFCFFESVSCHQLCFVYLFFFTPVSEESREHQGSGGRLGQLNSFILCCCFCITYSGFLIVHQRSAYLSSAHRKWSGLHFICFFFPFALCRNLLISCFFYMYFLFPGRKKKSVS